MLQRSTVTFALVLMSAATACGAGTNGYPITPPEFDRMVIADVLDELNAAAAAADEERYFALYTEDAVFLGTDATEHWTLDEFRTFAHPFFERGRAWTFRTTRREIYYDGTSPNIAWFDEDLATDMGPARGSGVLRMQPDGRWKIAHYNLALTIPNERLDEVKALLAGPQTAADGDADGSPDDSEDATGGNANGEDATGGDANGASVPSVRADQKM